MVDLCNAFTSEATLIYFMVTNCPVLKSCLTLKSEKTTLNQKHKLYHYARLVFTVKKILDSFNFMVAQETSDIDQLIG